MIIIHDKSKKYSIQYIKKERKSIIVMLTSAIVTVYIDKLGHLDVAD